jgi:ankyrin repeat protein
MAVASLKGHLNRESARDTWNEPKKSIQYFIRQSIPMSEANMVLGQEVPSYCRSVMKGDMELIKKAHTEKRDINVTLDNKSRCLLHYGLLATVDAEKRCRNLELLLKLGADLEQRDEYGRTPLHLAVLLGDIRAVDVLLKGGCNPRAKCHGNSLLHLATISGNIAMFEKVCALPACSFNPCDLTEYGFTMVHVAALYDQHQMIPFLKKSDVSVDQTSRIQIGSGTYLKGVMPVGIPGYHQYLLQYAQSDLSKKMVETIIEIFSRSSSVEKLHALADSLTGKEGNSIVEEQPIFCAVQFGFLPTVKALVEEGADTSIVSTYGNSLLQTAVTFGHLKIVKYLFPLCVWVSGRFHPINAAIMFDDANVVRYLVREYHRFGLPIECLRYNSGETAPFSILDLAVTVNRPSIVQMALTMEHEGIIVKSQHSIKNPNILLLKSIVGGWAMNVLSKVVPQMAPLLDSEKHQQEVISYLLGLPGCDPLQILPNVNYCVLDLAVIFSQSNGVDVCLRHLKRCNIRLPLTSLSMHDSQRIPLPHLCMCLPYTIEQCPLKDEFIMRLLSSAPYPEDIFFTTFEVLLSHGYDINALDSNGLTCLDHAVKFRSSKVQEFLRSHGASTTEEMQQRSMLETAEEIAKENEQLSVENKKLFNVISSALKHVLPDLSIGLSGGHLHSTQPSASAPTQLSEIKLEDGISVYHPDILRMAAHWSTIAARLGIELPIIDIIKQDYPSQAERACHEMLRRWCARDELTGKQPRTLDAVLTAMKACGLEEYAKQVQKRH